VAEEICDCERRSRRAAFCFIFPWLPGIALPELLDLANRLHTGIASQTAARLLIPQPILALIVLPTRLTDVDAELRPPVRSIYRVNAFFFLSLQAADN
jgi:hypothetical protein